MFERVGSFDLPHDMLEESHRPGIISLRLSNLGNRKPQLHINLLGNLRTFVCQHGTDNPEPVIFYP